MFVFKPRFEIVFRILLATTILFSAPMNVFSAKADDITVTPPQPPSVTPAVETTPTPMETAIPGTETPLPVTETSTPMAETAEPTTTETVPQPATAPKMGTENIPILTLSSNPSFLTPGGIINLDWSIENIDISGLILQIVLPEGITPHGSNDGIYDEVTHTLSITLVSISGKIQFRTADAISDVNIEAFLLRAGETQAKADLYLPAHEQFVVGKQGGQISAMKGKVKLEIPPDTLAEDVIIDIGKPSGKERPQSSLSGNAFEINAHASLSGEELKHFGKKLSIFVSYADLEISEAVEGDLYVYWFNPEIGEWAPLPSKSYTDTKTVHAFTDHFTVFDINIYNWQASHLPTVDSFQVSQFTGAATYSYPIEIPSGPGSFQPSLSLNYNSQIVDQSTLIAQASWVGMGWSLETGSIELDTHGTNSWTGDDSFLLNVGGVSTRIVKDTGGVYHAADENFWKISYIPYDLSNSDESNIWVVQDKDGSIYKFKHKSYYEYGWCDTGPLQWITYRWSLTEATNKFNQTIKYTYTDQIQTIEVFTMEGGNCTAKYPNAIAATYPSTIEYAGGKYRIRFDIGSQPNRWDYPTEWDWFVFSEHEKSRLETIYVEQDADGDQNFDVIRSYQLSYKDESGINDWDIIFPGYTASAGGKTLTLKQVKQYGVELYGRNVPVKDMPAVTFTYGDNLHLTRADNGYGGAVEFSYEFWYTKDYARESQTVKIDFGTNNSPCFTSDPLSWEPREPAMRWCENGKLAVQAGTVTSDTVRHPPDIFASSAHFRDMVRPGGIYRLTASIAAQGNSIYMGLYDGETDHWDDLGPTEFITSLPASASKADPLISAVGAPSDPALISWFQIQLLPSIYRVAEKRVYDRTFVPGNTRYYSTTYSYSDSTGDTARINDRTIAPNSTCDPGSTTCFAYAETFSEFRGHSTVTEVGPDGVKTVTKFYQDDNKKGRIQSVTVSAGTAQLSKTEYSYSYNPLSIMAYKACANCPNYIGIGRAWTYTDYETKTVYGTATTKTRVDNNFESTYGNLIEQIDEYLDASTWKEYRKTTYEYWPKNTSQYYLASLPGKIKGWMPQEMYSRRAYIFMTITSGILEQYQLIMGN